MTGISLGRSIGVYMTFIIASLVLLFVMNRFTAIPGNTRVGIAAAVAVGMPTLVVSYLNYVS
jgi:riboflavin transporter FmnP